MTRYIKEVYNLRPWYHDFAKLDVQTNFPPEKQWVPKKLRRLLFGDKTRGISWHAAQQPRKEKIISAYLKKVTAEFDYNKKIRILYLFSSDGYYGFLAQKYLPHSHVLGIDKNNKDIMRARLMQKHIGTDAEFIADDVINYINKYNGESFDLVLCLGGLYHVENPKMLLASIVNKKIGKYILIQSAITVEHNDPNYFETPHPGWTWGSWFTDARLENWLKELGYKVIEHSSDRRVGLNPKKIGASYFLAAL